MIVKGILLGIGVSAVIMAVILSYMHFTLDNNEQAYKQFGIIFLIILILDIIGSITSIVITVINNI